MNHSPFPFDLVGFDLDGTLLDTSADIGHALNHALAGAGRAPLPVENASRLIGGGIGQALVNALAISGGPLPPEAHARAHDDFVTFYTANIAVHTRLYPGGEAMLDDLAGHGVRLAVATNKREGLAVKILTELGLVDRFACVIGGDTLGTHRAKPKPDMLHEMIARSGVAPPVHTAFVGDTTYDVGAARAAGLPVVAVRFGFNDLPADALGADAVIDHYDELVPALAALGG